MVVVNAMANGQAPAGLSVGDFVNTNGGMYQIATPGSYGAVYNPASGYWSYKLDSDEYRLQSLMNNAQSLAQQNTMTSQDFAREQMAFQNTSAQKAMKFSAEQAQLQRDWQEGLSNTAHQREVKDLIAAGLNPILSSHSQGATTPSGAAASGVTSSGASGSVDTSGTNAVAQMITTMLNNQTSLDIARLQTAATMYAADQGLIGTQFAANMGYEGVSLNALNAALLQEDTQRHDEYMAKTYPTKDRVIGTYLAKLGDILTDMFQTTSGNGQQRYFDDWKDFTKDYLVQYKNQIIGDKAVYYKLLLDKDAISPKDALALYKAYKNGAGKF